MKLYIHKSQFLQKKITFFSWSFTANKILPSESLVKKLFLRHLLSTEKQLISALATINYIFNTILDYAKKTTSIRKLLSGRRPYDSLPWPLKAIHDFESLMQEIYKNRTFFT